MNIVLPCCDAKRWSEVQVVTCARERVRGQRLTGKAPRLDAPVTLENLGSNSSSRAIVLSLLRAQDLPSDTHLCDSDRGQLGSKLSSFAHIDVQRSNLSVSRWQSHSTKVCRLPPRDRLLVCKATRLYLQDTISRFLE